jgi:sec-independent protein translocase protein TatB
MFDISFSELALCFIVALVVLGPERLPKVARMVGRWSGQARAYMRNLSTELERETSVADIKRQFQEAQQALLESKAALEQSTRALTDEVKQRIQPPGDAEAAAVAATTAVPTEPPPAEPAPNATQAPRPPPEQQYP